MKLIPKYQKGGNQFLSFFAEYSSNLQPSRQSVREGSTPVQRQSKRQEDEDSSKGTLTEKDFFTLIKELDALPNERKKILDQIQEMFSTQFLDPDAGDIKQMYLKAINLIGNAKDNKTKFDSVITTLENNDAGGEPAITQNGQLVVINEDGDLGYVTPEEFSEGEYTIVTNDDLVQLRMHSKAFINDQKTLDILNNPVSFKMFQDIVDKAKVTLGTTELSAQGYINATSQQQALEGLKVLKALSQQGAIMASASTTLEGMYKYDTLSKDQKHQISALLDYMSKVIPKKVKTWASVVTGNNNPNGALQSLLINYLGAQSSTTFNFDYNYEGTEKDVKKSKSSGSSDGIEKLKFNTPSLFISGRGEKEMFTINPGTDQSFNVSSNMQPLTNSESKPLGPMCTLYEASKGEWQGSLDWSNATMGGRKISMIHFNQVLIKDGRAYSIDFPVDQNGNPDLRPSTKEQRNKAIQDLKSKGIDIDDPESIKGKSKIINDVLNKYELPAMFDSNGNMISSNWQRFAVMNGVADDKVLGIDPLDREIPILNKIVDESFLEERDHILSEKLDRRFRTEYDNWFSKNDDVYEGTIWIPVNNDYFNALVGSGTQLTPGQITDIDLLQAQRSARNNYVQTPPF